MTVETIAKVLADIHAGRVRNVVKSDPKLFGQALRRVRTPGKVIDATAVYRALVAREEPVYVYEDHPCIAPPFTRFDVCYTNEHGNAIIMSAEVTEHADCTCARDAAASLKQVTNHVNGCTSQPPMWEPAEPVDWDRVRWTIDTMLWCGGYSATKAEPVPTFGPCHMWRFAVYEDGRPADLHWVQLLADYPMENWDMAHLVMLGTLNFLGCRNVQIVEPHRPRPVRRRLDRTAPGVTFHELTVFPTSRRSAGGSRTGEGVPLTTVRGHFAHYGNCCPGTHDPRGLLFGKLEGRFFIPQHARGIADLGEHESSYRIAVP